MRQAIAKNLRTLWLLKGLESAWFPIPIIVLFYESHGLSLEQAVILKAILSAAFFIGEIPSGYFADHFGRKTSLICGSLFWLIGWLTYCTQGSFAWFAIAEITVGLGGSLMSGAESAIAYDSLLVLKRTSEYRAWEGKGVAIMGITEAVCGLVGAYVATWNLVYPFYLQTLCVFAYFCCALTLCEPPRSKLEKTVSWRSLLTSIQAIFQKQKSLRWLLLFSATLSAGSFLMVWISQEYMTGRGFEVSDLGWAWVVFHSAMAIASFNVEIIARRFSFRLIFAALPILMAIAYIGMGLVESIWGVLFIMIVYGVRGVNMPLVLSYLNDQIPSNLRATLISVNSFTFRLMFIGVAAIASIASRILGFEMSLILIGLIIGLIAYYGYLRLRLAL
ncbi:MAG: MFS transporter [Limnothrix sp.]